MEFRKKSLVRYILLPFVLALFAFSVIRPISAQIIEDREKFLSFLLTGNVEVGVETINERSHIYYAYEDKKQFITNDDYNNKHPKASGEYITFVKEINGEGQIFLYNILTEKTIQLTRSGPNLNPSVSRQGNAAWEGWVYNSDGSGTWQIFVFDGTQIRQITQGDFSVNANIEGDYVLFSRKDSLGEWRSDVYSLKEKDTRDVAVGFKNKTVKLVGDSIVYDDGGVFPLKPQDFFLLDIDTDLLPAGTPEATPVLATGSAEPVSVSLAPELTITPTAIPSPAVTGVIP